MENNFEDNNQVNQANAVENTNNYTYTSGQDFAAEAASDTATAFSQEAQYQQAAPEHQQPQYQQAAPEYQQPQYQQAAPDYQQPQYQQAAPDYQQPQYQQAAPDYPQPQYQQAAPDYQQPQYQQHAAPNYQQNYAMYNQAGTQGTVPASALAITSISCGIASVVLFMISVFPMFAVISLLTGIAGIVTGIMAINKNKAEPDKYGGRTFAITGIICGAIALAFLLIFTMTCYMCIGNLADLGKY